IHSHPASTARAAWKASGIKFPFIPGCPQNCRKISQWRWPGATITALGRATKDFTKLMARAVGDGERNTLGWVTTRRNPERTRDDMAYGSGPPMASWSHSR